MSGDLKERTEKRSVAERVAAGAAWLDQNRPGWDDRIDLTRLILSSPCQCILGQLDGDYDQVPEIASGEIDPLALGFNADPRSAGTGRWSERVVDDFLALESEWKRVINVRRVER